MLKISKYAKSCELAGQIYIFVSGLCVLSNEFVSKQTFNMHLHRKYANALSSEHCSNECDVFWPLIH